MARYALAACLTFNPLDRDFVESLGQDASLLQTAAMMAETYFQSMRGQKDRNSTLTQVSKTIRLLRKRLSVVDNLEQVSNHTLYVVACLASYARVLGDDNAVRKHLEGIHRMIFMRGGTRKVTETKLLVEILR